MFFVTQPWWLSLSTIKMSDSQNFHYFHPWLHQELWTVLKHLFGNMKDVFFIVFNTSKLLLFCISLSCVDRMSCFPPCIQIFIFAPTHLPHLPRSSFLRYILPDPGLEKLCARSCPCTYRACKSSLTYTKKHVCKLFLS